MKTEDLIQLNADLQTKLTKVNEEYYGDFLVYVRTMSFLRDEQQTEEVLLSILQDILDAQKSDITAEEYFGKNPKEFADEILQQLSVNLIDTSKLVIYAIGAYFLFSALPSLINPTTAFDLGTFFVTGIYVGFFSVAALWLLGKSIYQSQRLFKVTAALLGALLFIGGIALSMRISTPLKVYFDGLLGSVVILIIALIIGYILSKQADKKLWLPFVPVLSTSALLGILSRVPIFSNFFDFSTQQGKIVLIITLSIALFLQFMLLFWIGRKSKQVK